MPEKERKETGKPASQWLGNAALWFTFAAYALFHSARAGDDPGGAGLIDAAVAAVFALLGMIFVGLAIRAVRAGRAKGLL